MSESDHEIAEVFVDGTKLVPHPTKGEVPLYEGHPPDTHVPMWRCPHCGESGVTMKDLWRLYRRRDRLHAEREAYEYPSEEWAAYQDGIREMNQHIGRLSGCLPSNVSSWVRKQVEPRRWEDSELNPENYRKVPREAD